MNLEITNLLAQVSFPCIGATDLGQCIAQIYTWSLAIVGLVAFIQLVYAGWIYMTSLGSPARIALAKEKIFNAILGILILLASYLILNTINPDLLKGGIKLEPINKGYSESLVKR